MGKIVYHGTFSAYPPHRYPTRTFHAGTRQSAEERLAEAEAITHGGVATIHAYDIHKDAPTAVSIYEDPLSSGMYKVPETSKTRIYPYINAEEDEGSISYVIPNEFVGKHVTHLGPQFQELRGKGGKYLANVMSVMVGGPAQNKL